MNSFNLLDGFIPVFANCSGMNLVYSLTGFGALNCFCLNDEKFETVLIFDYYFSYLNKKMKTYEVYGLNSTASQSNYYTNKLKQSQTSLKNYNDSFQIANTNNTNSANFISTKSLPFFESQPVQKEESKYEKDIRGLTEELQKANEMIELLKSQNQSLLAQRDSAVNQLNRIKTGEMSDREGMKDMENYANVTKEKLGRANQRILDLENENHVLKNELQRLNEDVYNKENIIEQCNNENRKLKEDLLKENHNIKKELEIEKKAFQNKKNELANLNKVLNEKVYQLENSLADAKIKNEQLEQEKQFYYKVSDNTKKALEYLFNHYNNTMQIFEPKRKKELLNEIIEVDGPEELKSKLRNLEEQIRTLYENYKLKFGKCFACDIACCTSHNQRIKFFQGK